MYERVEQSVYAYQAECVNKYEKQYAFEYFGNNIRYSDAKRMIENAAAMLEKLGGVVAGDVVAVIAPMIPEVVYSFYAISKLGATFFPIDPRTNAERIQKFLEMTKVKTTIMLDQAYLKILPAVKALNMQHVFVVSLTDSMPCLIASIYEGRNRKICKQFNQLIARNGYDTENQQTWNLFENIANKEEREFCIRSKDDVLKHWYIDHTSMKLFVDWSDAISRVSGEKVANASYVSDHIAALTLTSGTTGMPKLVPTKDRSYNVKIRDYYHTTMPISAGDRILSMPPFLLYGEVFMHMAFCRGVQNVIIPDITQFKYDEVIYKKKVSHAVGVPSQMLSFCDSKFFRNKPPKTLKTVSVGGTRMLKEHEQQINKVLEPSGIVVTQGYSMSELTPSSFTNTPGNVKETSVGQALGDTKAVIVDVDTMEILGANKEGELWIHSETQFDGYYLNEMDSSNVFTEYNGERYVKTGDRAFYDEDGYFYIKGRSKEMVIRPDGHNVFPSELEDIVSENEAVKDCAVVGVPYPNYSEPIGEYPKVHFSIKDGVSKTNEQIIEELKAYCAEKLPERDVPYYYQVHNKIPMTPVLKPDKMKLREMDKAYFLRNSLFE